MKWNNSAKYSILSWCWHSEISLKKYGYSQPNTENSMSVIDEYLKLFKNNKWITPQYNTLHFADHLNKQMAVRINEIEFTFKGMWVVWNNCDTF